MKGTILCLLFIILGRNTSSALTLSSSISYKHLSGSSYLVIYKTIRDCRSLPLGGTGTGVLISCDSGSQAMAMTRISIRNVTFNQPTNCKPSNQMTSLPGTEEHTFECIVGLDTFAKGIFKNCCKIWFSSSSCCKNGIITTLTPGSSYYECMLDRCLASGNSGPVFLNTNAFRLRLNQPNYYNVMAIDTADHDLLTYELFKPMEDKNTYVSYTSGYDERYPFTPLCSQVGQKNCPASPTLMPPRGLYLDSMNGNLFFTPTNATEITVICFRVREYRMINGIKTLIGYYTADNQHNASTTFVNEPVLSKNTMTLEHHFTADKTQSIVFVTEQNDTNKKDSVRIFVTNPITNSSVAIDDKWRSNGSFTWTPTCKDIRDEPHFFIIHFYNETKNTFDYQSIAVNIFVHSDIDLGNDTVICKNGSLQFQSGIDGTHRWNGSNSDTLQTYTANSAGKYWLDVTRNACKVSDTILLRETTMLPEIDLGPDTLLCGQAPDHAISLGVTLQKDVQYTWNIQPGFTNSKLQFKDTGLVILKGINVCGTKSDSIRVSRMNAPTVHLPDDTLLCLPGVYRLFHGGNALGKWLWNNQSKDSFLDVVSAGMYWVKTNNACGEDADSISIRTLEAPKVFLGRDTIVCNAAYPRLNAAFPGAAYLWSTADTSSFIQILDSGSYSVSLSNYCGVARDTILVKSQFTPIADLGMDIISCAPLNITLQAGFPNAFYSWNSSETSPSIQVSQAGMYWVRINNLCGADSDTINVFEKTKPVVNLGKDTSLKKPFSITLNAGTGEDKYLWNTSASDTFSSLVVNDFGNYIVRVGNACGTSYDTIRISDKTGIESHSRLSLLLYPNPSKDGQIHIEHGQESLQVRVFALDGKLLREIILSDSVLDLHDLQDGTYFLSIQSGAYDSGHWISVIRS